MYKITIFAIYKKAPYRVIKSWLRSLGLKSAFRKMESELVTKETLLNLYEAQRKCGLAIWVGDYDPSRLNRIY